MHTILLDYVCRQEIILSTKISYDVHEYLHYNLDISIVLVTNSELYI